MLCQNCNKNLATVRYAEVVDGKVTDRHLCHECLAKHQENAATGFGLAGPAPSLRPSPGLQFVRDMDMATLQRQCPSCGLRLLRMLKTAVLGCPICYSTFAAQLELIVDEVQGASSHRGKAPKTDDARAQVHAQLQAKRALLRTSVQMEKYEDAARLRDEIRDLEAELSGAESRRT